MTIEQAEKSNVAFATVLFQDSLLGEYRVLVDSLDHRVFRWQKIAAYRGEQFEIEQSKEPIYNAQIQSLKKENKGWKAAAGVSLLIAVASWIF